MDRQALVQYVIPLVVIGIVLTIRMRSMSKSRKFRPDRLWIAPVLLIAIASVTIATHPPHLLGLVICFVALIMGAAVGWHRGKLMRLDHDPATGEFVQTASPAAMALLVGIIAVRFAVKSYFHTNPTSGAIDEQTLVATDALLLFAVGMISMTRVEMGLRARGMLAQRSARP
jgi:cytochrome bd-type quinol oxidase subunit 2